MTSVTTALVEHLMASIDADALQYCRGEYSWDWRSKHAFVEAKKPGAYEEALETFVTPGATSAWAKNGSLLILVGVAGSGKTTAVQHAINAMRGRTRQCGRHAGSAACDRPPPLIRFDFSSWQPRPLRRQADFVEEEEKFWFRLATSLEATTPME